MRKFLFFIFSIAAFATNGLAQNPDISYNVTSVKLVAGKAMATLTPTNKGGAIPSNVAYGQVTTFAGSRPDGNQNGTGRDIRFYKPAGIAIDKSGNVYVSDGNNIIRKITPAGVATTFAGSTYGFAEGTGTTAKFYTPLGIAFDAPGNLYVADAENNRIRKITPAGVVTTFAGNGTGSHENGPGTQATFYHPLGVAVDPSGNVYVADEYNNMIRKITPGGVVSLFAGQRSPGFKNGPAAIASFNYPTRLEIDKHGNFFVADNNNGLIRKITPGGIVSTFAGWNATGAVAPVDMFKLPISVRVDANDNVYVADAQLNKIFKITPDGNVSTLAGSGRQDINDGIGTEASFYIPEDMALDGLNAMYVTDNENNEIRKIALTGYSITPSLPPGISFNNTTGVISGTPAGPVPPTTYTVTGYNSKGSSSFNITLSTSGVTPPAITSYSPAHAKTGDAITITGTNLTGVTSVTFGGVPATSFTVNSATSITARVGAGASGNIIVTNNNGTATAPGFIYDATLNITSFTPTSAGSGQTVTITGSNFTNVTAVSFGGKPAASFGVNSSVSITALVGSGASGNVTVTTTTDTASLAGFKFIRGPSITTIDATTSGGVNTVVITGSYFSDVTSVKFGNSAATSFTVNSDNKITAKTSLANFSTITIVAPGGTTVYNLPKPVITGFTPTAAAAAKTVVITGANFNNVASVSFGGTPAASFGVNSSGSITAIVGFGSSGDVSVTTIAGKATLAGFKFIQATGLSISSFTPKTGSEGVSVKLTGTGFTGASAVTFGGIAAKSFTVNSPTSITAVVGKGASGNVTVTTSSGSAALGGFIFTGAPVITSFSPNTSGPDELVIINGENFTGAMSVKFGGVDATYFNVDSPTQISAVTGKGASGNVTVTTTGGTASAGGFLFVPVPGITSFTPQHGAQGETVVINGSHFTGVDVVEFGGVKAKSFTVVSDSQIKAVIGDGASGKIYIEHSGESTTAGLFTYDSVVHPPKITSFDPKTTGANTTVTITGAFFTGTTNVTFGGTGAASFKVISDTQIIATIAEGAGSTGLVAVLAPGGTATAGGFVFVPKPVITPAGPVTLTPGGNVLLQTTAIGPNNTYQWYRDSAPVAGAITASYTADKTGVYYLGTTVNKYTVNSNAVIVNADFTLPVTNFSVQVTNLACKGDNNGIISIKAQKTFNYTATISGDTIVQRSFPFTNDLTLSNLRTGGYTVCISVEGYPQYQQCYMLTLSEPKDLAVYTAVDRKKSQVNLQLNGGNSYTIRLNNAVYTTSDSLFTLTLAKGSNKLSVSTDKLCQGAVEKIINDTDNLTPYPNPFEESLYVNLGEAIVDVATVKIYSVSDGRLIQQHIYKNESGVVKLDVSGMVTGVYSYHLLLNNTESVFKIYKK